MKKIKRKSKKADVQISMSWIFMIIIGTFFIILAYNVISKYSHIENDKLQVEIGNNFRDILNNVGRTSGIEEDSLQPIGSIFKDSRVEIKCFDNIPILSINGRFSSSNEYLKNNPIFMTYIEQGKIDKTYLAVESYKLPFKITTMLALVSKKNLIVLDNSSLITKEILNKFNVGSFRELNYVTKDFSTLNSQYVTNINDKNYNSVMFVSDYGKKLPIDLDKINARAYWLKVNVSNPQIDNITYQIKNGSKFNFNFIDYDKKLSLVTMAIFSSPNVFRCSYNKIINLTIPVYSYYVKKCDYLENLSNYSKVCSDSVNTKTEYIFYKDERDMLNSVIKNIEKNKAKDVNSLLENVSGVQNVELELEKFSCIYVY